MTRDLEAATQAAAEAAVIVPVWFVKLEFDSGTITTSTYDSDIVWHGDTYIGAGAIGNISPVEEDAELSRSTLELSLRGLPTDIVAIAMGEHYQGRPATLYQGYLNQSTRVLVDDPAIIYRGRMDTCAVVQGEGDPPTMNVTLSVESRFAAWDRPKVSRYNDADQQARYPGDLGFQFVEQSTEKTIVWGQG